MRVNLETFYGHFEKALEEGYAALFAGADLSRPFGFVDRTQVVRENFTHRGAARESPVALLRAVGRKWSLRRSLPAERK